MKIGLMHLTPYSKADPAIVAKRAEDLGFESYWVGDHTIIPETSSVQYPGVRAGGAVPDFLWQLPDPLLVLARAGATTTRIKLGTGVCLIPERNPILGQLEIEKVGPHAPSYKGARIRSWPAATRTGSRRPSLETNTIANGTEPRLIGSADKRRARGSMPAGPRRSPAPAALGCLRPARRAYGPRRSRTASLRARSDRARTPRRRT